MEGYKKMTPGQPAPDFILRDVEGNNFQLSELGHKYVLVLFWSSTCEGCRELLPQLHNWYLSENDYDLEVVAISIDTSEANFEYLYKQIHPSWISVHDPLGWNGMVPSNYQVYATPSLFLLDRERTILARPGSFRQFQRAMKKLSP
jgi:thiol-disulfide isomerase/thioredoxin